MIKTTFDLSCLTTTAILSFTILHRFYGIGGGAQTALAAAGIKLYGGVSGDADEAVEAFINKTLDYNPDVKCSHHEHSHGEGHTCGEHGCGSHSCH